MNSSQGARLRSARVLGAGTALLALVVLVGLTMLGGQPVVPPPAGPTPTAGAPASSAPSPSPSPSPSPTPSPTASASLAPSPTPLSPYAPLDGMPAEPQLAHRLPLAVMVDNNSRARPQAGFNRAAIVYHAPNDGGTNRYMLIFQEQDAELVGPVRSTRPFFNAWASEYRAAFSHFGGDWRSIKRLREIDGEFVYDIDALRGSGRPYWRERDRRAPFNAFSSTERLWEQAAANGAPPLMVEQLPLRSFGDDLPAAERPAGGSISLPYRGSRIDYAYDQQSNSYLRSVNGEAQRDALDDSRVAARNVIVQFVDVYYDPAQRYNRAVMEYVGAGRAIVFRDGLAIEGSWRKDAETDLTRFLDETGDEISLVRGPIWIQVLAEDAKVTYEARERR